MYEKRSLDASNFQELLDVLSDEGYRIIGPRVRNGVISYEEIRSIADLPHNITDEQSPGRYRTTHHSSAALFDYRVGAQSWKKFLHPAQVLLWKGTSTVDGIEIRSAEDTFERIAFIGVRPCDIHAIRIQNSVLENSAYQQRLNNALIVAVQCTEPGATCFCASMQTGPSVSEGFDLALTEICANGRHVFLVETGSEKGAQVLAKVSTREADDTLVTEATALRNSAAERMKRKVETDGLKELLYASLDHPEWQTVAQRCLSCGSCTMVCPTCFCATLKDSTNLAGNKTERWQVWDSCFNSDFTYIHGGSIRRSIKSRYRQWLTHKMATWREQFGSSGCVGCGRCITWCPAGIDLTQVLGAIRQPRNKKVLDDEEVDL